MRIFCCLPRIEPGLLLSRALLWGLLVLGAAVDASAQGTADPVYRCGNSYSSKPCPGAVAVDVADPRSPAQQRAAQQASQRDAALARQMQADRLAAERAAPKGGAANVGPVAAKPPAKAASKSQHPPKPKKHAATSAAKSASSTGHPSSQSANQSATR